MGMLLGKWSNALEYARRLSYEEECTLSISCKLFGPDCHSEFDQYGGAVLMALVVLYTFKVLGSLCDGHLTAVVQRIVDRLGIPADVAGATFMAMASSAPEVALTIFSTFLLPSASGAACVVGSALFNLQIIVGVLPLVSITGPLQISWYVSCRDCLYYAFSLIELLIFCLDGKIEWWEALIMVLTYSTYVVYLAFYNASVMRHYGLETEEDVQGTREFDGEKVKFPAFKVMCNMRPGEKMSEKEMQLRWMDLKRTDWKSEAELDEFFQAHVFRYFDTENGAHAHDEGAAEPEPSPSPAPEPIGLEQVVLFQQGGAAAAAKPKPEKMPSGLSPPEQVR